MYDEAEWEKIEALLGKVVANWGRTMGIVYGLPGDLELESANAIRICLAECSGDGKRLSLIRKLLASSTYPSHAADRIKSSFHCIKKLEKLSEERDALVHGIPVWSAKKDVISRQIIRRGWYLVQERKVGDSERYLKVPEAAITFLEKLQAAHEKLLQIAKPMLFEDWEGVFQKEDIT